MAKYYSNLKEFLTNYYYQLQFDSMPFEVKARLADYVKKGDFVGEMKNWAEIDGLMIVDKSTKPTTYKLKSDVVDAEIDPSDNKNFKKLFYMFQEAFEQMSSDRNSFKYNKPANDFLDNWFGPDKLFSMGTASTECMDGIKALQKLLENNKSLIRYISKNKIGGLETDDDVEDFVQSKMNTPANPKDAKYNTDGKTRQRITQITNALLDAISYVTFEQSSEEYKAIKNASNDLKKISFQPRDFQAKIDTFKGDYKDLLKTLFSSGKIRDVFSSYGSDITKYINGAKDHIPYDKPDAKEYIPPKRDEELSTWQKLQKWTDDTYSNYFKKFVGLSGDRLFFSDKAKEIFAAIDKEKITPKDGLGAIVEKASAIKKRVEPKSKQAADHFDWFTKTMTAIKDDKPKDFANALHNGPQMLSIVSEVIIRAVESGIPGDIDKAKSSMELLASMQYGLHTSKTMDAIRKEKFTILGDEKLSWNKNKAVNMVTRGADNVFRLLVLGVGHVATTITNAARLSGNTYGKKFQHGKNDKTGGAMAQLSQNKDAQFANEKKDVNDKIKQKDKIIAAQQRLLATMNIGQLEQDVIDRTNDLVPATQAQENAEKTLVQWMRNNPNHADIDTLNEYFDGTSKASLHFTDSAVENMVIALDSANNALQMANNDLQTARDKRQQFYDADESIKTIQAQKKALQDKLNTWDEDHVNQYQDLAKYWDMLQEGRTSHFGHMWSLSFGNAKDKKLNVKDIRDEFMRRHAHQIAA